MVGDKVRNGEGGGRQRTLCTLCFTLIPGLGCVPCPGDHLSYLSTHRGSHPLPLLPLVVPKLLQCPGKCHLPAHHQGSFLVPPTSPAVRVRVQVLRTLKLGTFPGLLCIIGDRGRILPLCGPQCPMVHQGCLIQTPNPVWIPAGGGKASFERGYGRWGIFLILVLQWTQSCEFQACSLSLQGSLPLPREGPFRRTSPEPPAPLWKPGREQDAVRGKRRDVLCLGEQVEGQTNLLTC